LPLLQAVSLFGVDGLGFLIHWFAAIAAAGVCERRLLLRETVLVVGLIVVTHIWGAWRIGTHVSSPSATVAAVQTDFDWFANPAIPPVEERREVTDRLFDRAVAAAKKGAQMVVWNEIDNIIDPPDEPALLQRAKALARDHRVHLVLS
jgi:apolipoprotein N-acyltransferase